MSLKQFLSLGVILAGTIGSFIITEQRYKDIKLDEILIYNDDLDLMICGILYIFSFICNNLEFFDSYWSLVPIQRIVMVLRKSEGTISLQENILLITLVSMWSIRIFWTIFQRWSGFPEQDWRLERMKLRYKKKGKYLGFFLYWTVGVGFFLFMNYKAMTLLLYNVVSHLVQKNKDFSQNFLGIFIMVIGLSLESYSDYQMLEFKQKDPSQRPKVLEEGFRKYLRFPQYLGEAIFWIGVYLNVYRYYEFTKYSEYGFGQIILIAFLHLSAFITDKKMSERPAYLEYKKKVPFYLIPFPRLK